MIILVVAVACAHSDPNVTKDLETSWSQFIDYWEAEDAKGCASMYAENGKNIAPELPVRQGRKEIEEFYASLFENHIHSDYRHDILSVETFDNQAVEVGQFQVDWMRNDSTEWTFRARSMTHWKKDSAGQWQIKQLLFNKDVPDN